MNWERIHEVEATLLNATFTILWIYYWNSWKSAEGNLELLQFRTNIHFGIVVHAVILSKSNMWGFFFYSFLLFSPFFFIFFHFLFFFETSFIWIQIIVINMVSFYPHMVVENVILNSFLVRNWPLQFELNSFVRILDKVFDDYMIGIQIKRLFRTLGQRYLVDIVHHGRWLSGWKQKWECN